MTTDEKSRNVQIITLSIDDIAEALEDCTYNTQYVLDLQDQEIIMLSEYLMASEEIQDFFEAIDEDETGRYVPFPVRIDSRDGYADMELFIDTIEDQQIHSQADKTIRGSGAFRRFKDFIRTYPDLEKRWYAWKDERTRLRAMKWLEEEGLILMNNK